MTGRRPLLGCSEDMQSEGEAGAHMKADQGKGHVGNDLCTSTTTATACNGISTFGSLHTCLQ